MTQFRLRSGACIARYSSEKLTFCDLYSARPAPGTMSPEQVAAVAPCPVIPLKREWLDRQSEQEFREFMPWIASIGTGGARESRKLEW